MNKTKSGFTIVELLIVIVVIGVLAAIVIVAYNGIQNRARAAALTADLRQAADKLTLYYFDNSLYPTTLAAAGVTEGSGSTFQYAYNNSASPPTYCVTGTNGSISYKVSDASTTPQSGGCPGHGVGGQSAVVNLAVNPSFESVTTSHNMYNGAAISRVAVGNAASGGYVGRVIKSTAGSGLITLSYPVAMTANSPVSARIKVRLAPGATSSNTVTATMGVYNGGSGVPGITGCSISNPGSLSTTSWSEIVIQGCTTPSTTMTSVGVLIYTGQAWSAGDGIELDAEIYVQSLTVPNFADGNSTDWVWNGAVNNSTSTGPAL